MDRPGITHCRTFGKPVVYDHQAMDPQNTGRLVQMVILILIIGSGLGYFLERWGTTQLCWTYHTGGTPPLFIVLVHGLASIAVWRAYRIYLWILARFEHGWVKVILPTENP